MTERMSAQQYREAVAKPKRGNKFGAKRTVFDDITFDSKREAEVYRDLKVLERVGRISGFERQRKFELIVNGEIIGTYRADFAFIDHDQDGRFRVVDVKGVITRDFRRVRKIIKAAYNIDVEVWK
ncbi:protein of unknown function DUF1064 [Rhizobium leguminosarum bv. trifolii WSM2304]|uniref:DUF1064 domain-containing protein n=1 Tax=Rhizobium leguminosarum bv. trifolii (strain WSM2304) TaxID=395492 RepID=A0ABF7QP06_RHILW|nr:DUF1064 domain-containing protein [Rhizobium leguminosarum]ACI55716.1 protein of unknown function DUF1064 [Rhizobium leguminosarum bv. trifolii WSM2304]